MDSALPPTLNGHPRSLLPAPCPMHETYENPLITRYASREMATLWGDQRKFSTWRRLWVALAEAEAELGLPITQAADRRAAGPHRRHRLRRRRAVRTQAAARRDGPRPRLRRPVPRGPADHPPRGHKLLRHRQHRPDPDPRIAADGRPAAGGGDRSRWPISPSSIATCRRSASRTCSRPSRRPSAGGPACGPTIWCSTWPKSSIASRR